MFNRIMLQNLNLKTKSILLFILLIFIPMILLVLIIYYQGNDILKRQVTDNIYEQLTTIDSNLNSIIEDVEDISAYMIHSDKFRSYMTLPLEDNQAELNNLHHDIRAFFTFHITNKPYFNSISIKGANGITLNAGQLMEGDEGFLDTLSVENDRRPVWTHPYLMSNAQWDSDDSHIITLYRVIYDLYDVRSPVGEVRIRLYERELYDHIVGSALIHHETMLIRPDGMVMFHTDETKTGDYFHDQALLKQLSVNQGNGVFLHDNGDEQVHVVNRRVAGQDLYLLSFVNDTYLNEELSAIRMTLQLIVGFTILFGLLAITGFFQTVIKPVLELTRETKKLEDGDFMASVDVRTNDEIGRLGSRFNTMVKQIQTLINTKYKLELQTKESELKSLQSQINPHFLYNTLDMIRWTARLEKAEETGKSIEDLSRIFRTNLSGGNMWITMNEELTYLDSYLKLQQRRLGTGFTFNIIAEHGTEQAYILKMLVQPLVENAIQHGFSEFPSQKNIYIRCYREQHDLMIDVIDNGKGMNIPDKTNLFPKPSHAGFGLTNIHERLIHTFGHSYGLFINKSLFPTGVTVSIKLPFMDTPDKLRPFTGKD